MSGFNKNWSSYTCDQLMVELRARNQPVSGIKSDLIARLETYDRNPQPAVAPAKVTPYRAGYASSEVQSPQPNKYNAPAPSVEPRRVASDGSTFSRRRDRRSPPPPPFRASRAPSPRRNTGVGSLFSRQRDRARSPSPSPFNTPRATSLFKAPPNPSPFNAPRAPSSILSQSPLSNTRSKAESRQELELEAICRENYCPVKAGSSGVEREDDIQKDFRGKVKDLEEQKTAAIEKIETKFSEDVIGLEADRDKKLGVVKEEVLSVLEKKQNWAPAFQELKVCRVFDL
jgi:hypothetical protein